MVLVCMYHSVTVFDVREYGHLYVISGGYQSSTGLATK